MTSNPDRIRDELLFLNEVGGNANVIPLITAIRFEDQIIAVYPYFKHEDFREYFAYMTVDDIRHYMRNILIAVHSVHKKGLIHRDLKPNNFLYSKEQKRGILVDFGLAQREPENIPLIEPKKMNMRSKVTIPLARDGLSILYTPNALNSLKKLAPGYYLNDTRGGMRANRAGTRGFRAPEVLFKHAQQSRAIDIWSVGVIYLCILTRRYPFFHSQDDQDALVEIACVVGINSLEKVANLCNRIWKHSLPDVPHEHIRFDTLVKALNPELAQELPEEAYDLAYKLMCPNWYERATVDEALQHSFLNKN
jgi:cell division control protein 7